MKVEIEDIRTVLKRQVYYANDGTRFENYNECLEYEMAHASPNIIAADAIKHGIVSREWVDSCATENDLIVIFFPTSFEDVLTIEAWAKEGGVDFEVGKVPVGQPILFDVGEYYYSKDYDENSLKGIGEVYGYLGSVKEFKVSYCKAIDVMIETAAKIAGY